MCAWVCMEYKHYDLCGNWTWESCLTESYMWCVCFVTYSKHIWKVRIFLCMCFCIWLHISLDSCLCCVCLYNCVLFIFIYIRIYICVCVCINMHLCTWLDKFKSSVCRFAWLRMCSNNDAHVQSPRAGTQSLQPVPREGSLPWGGRDWGQPDEMLSD